MDEEKPIRENCSCGKPGIFDRINKNYLTHENNDNPIYDNDTNSQYCNDCWKEHCAKVQDLKNKNPSGFEWEYNNG